MSKPNILEAAIVQKIRYESKEEMYRINARKANNGQRIVYKRIDEHSDGTVTAMIMVPYNNKPLLGETLEV